MKVNGHGFEIIKELYKEDKFLRKIIKQCSNSPYKEFVFQDGFLFRRNQLCIPDCSIRLEIIKEAHDVDLVAKESVIVLDPQVVSKPVAKTTTDDAGTSTTLILGPVTIEEKAKKKNDVKTRSMLLMALPNEHLMTFNQYKDDKNLFAAIEIRFGVNEATKKTQKTLLNTADLSDVTTYAFLTNQPNGSQLVHEDLEQIHKDDLEEIDLKWQLALLSMRANRFFQKTSKKITINGSDTAGYNKAKVECFNCYIMRHFARECRVLRNQENKTKSQETTRRTVNVEDTSSKAMVAIDGAGFHWSYMANNEAPTNMAFMALSDSELEKISNEKDALETKIDKFENASQSLDKLIGSQVSDNSKKGLGYVSYNVVLPPHTRMFSPPRIDLSPNGLLEFTEPGVQRYGVKPIEVVTQNSSVKISAHVKENNGAPLIKDWESDEEDEVESPPEKERKTVEPSMDKVEVEIPKQNDKPARRPVKYAEMYKTQRTRGNQRNWNNLKSHQLGSNFVMYNKACYICGSFNHLQARCKYHQRERMVNGTHHSMVNHNANTVPKAILTRTCLKPVNSVRPVNPKRNFQRRAACNNINFFKKVNTAREKVNTARPNLAVLNTVRINKADESYVLLKVPRKNNMYSVDMKNIVPKKDLTCLVAKATNNESMLWHRRLSHINFKNINKVVKDNLVRGLPTKHFENNQTYVACLKGKQHKVSFKSKIHNFISQPLFIFHIDLFGPTSVSSIMHKKYSLVITDDFSRFTWVFFLATKDETSRILKSFFTEIKNLVDKKVKTVRCDNGTKFKNRVMNEFCEEKGIKREYNIARTPQQNGVAKRRNMTLIEAARTIVPVVKPHFKTPYELFRGRTPTLSFMRPFGYDVTILNTLDHLGKFNGKSDEGFFVGYSTNSKAFRVYDTKTRKVEENLRIKFLEKKPLIASINSNDFAAKGASFDADSDGANQDNDGPSTKSEIDNQKRPNDENSTKDINTVRPSINTASLNINTASPIVNTFRLSDDFVVADNDMKSLDGVEPDISNISTTYPVTTTPNTRINKDHSLDNVIGDIQRTPLLLRLQVKHKSDGIFITQDKYVDHILRKFKYEDVKPGSTPMDKEKVLLKDSDGNDVDVHLYMSMIGSLMYLTSSRLDIMFVVCTCTKFQCKKQNVVATSTTEAEYVAAASCCGQVLWIQNQLLNYGISTVSC
nr:putative ribonuclease H-like domain-containing protein [Tanacetum cinerariifolium]